jgi:His-Xaa-Ser system protein HxsD
MELRFNKGVYDKEALLRASYSLANILTVRIDDAGDSWCAAITPSADVTVDTARDEFLIAANDEELRRTIRGRTEQLRMLILAHAYSRTKFSAPETPAQG